MLSSSTADNQYLHFSFFAKFCSCFESMPEVPHTGEYHCNAVFIRGGDDFVVAH
jgi:hypothetical protein